MTVNEIIKALDEIAHNENLKQYSGIPDVAAFALDLIKRQKAEIERLIGMVSQNEGVLPQYENLIKSETIKEFAEELKQRLIARGIFPVLVKNEIDNIVKEMTEGKNDR